ncbi:hypothetical protein POX_d06101 [Penicillium oxalicum]|uniref:hypothetical protein n=1 Tax=Penicillium oxalicum TaxID=69781 RepID=UPI0020B69578|nr:hypothetical protein POX_d06101 [Penicillium oxalicum]KAI2790580.1 hypothetical protein POX_d06101 [Penicillium oxalicum]
MNGNFIIALCATLPLACVFTGVGVLLWYRHHFTVNIMRHHSRMQLFLQRRRDQPDLEQGCHHDAPPVPKYTRNGWMRPITRYHPGPRDFDDMNWRRFYADRNYYSPREYRRAALSRSRECPPYSAPTTGTERRHLKSVHHNVSDQQNSRSWHQDDHEANNEIQPRNQSKTKKNRNRNKAWSQNDGQSKQRMNQGQQGKAKGKGRQAWDQAQGEAPEQSQQEQPQNEDWGDQAPNEDHQDQAQPQDRQDQAQKGDWGDQPQDEAWGDQAKKQEHQDQPQKGEWGDQSQNEGWGDQPQDEDRKDQLQNQVLQDDSHQKDSGEGAGNDAAQNPWPEQSWPASPGASPSSTRDNRAGSTKVWKTNRPKKGKGRRPNKRTDWGDEWPTV